MPETVIFHQERRRHPRVQLQMRIQCIRLDPDGGDVLAALDTIDISRSGVGAMADRPFYPGQRVLLSMPMTSADGHRNIYATIVRCRQEQEGYRIGLKFDAASQGLWYSDVPVHAAA